jgi:ribonucleoside-diphosphate reductase alpha chain
MDPTNPQETGSIMIDRPEYQPTGLAAEIFQKRYAIYPEETWQDACKRVADFVSKAELGSDIASYQKQFNHILVSGLFAPGGRIMYGSGRPRGQLLNCFVVPTSDSREGWGKLAYDTLVISGTGGGVGTNYSPVRNRGSNIRGTGGTATGATSLMSIINAEGEEIKAGGGRRTALMMALEHDHPDVEEFLNKKLDLGKLNNANVSVIFDKNPEKFFDQVRKGENVKLTFGGRTVKEIPAKELWDKIIQNALRSGEPGVLNGWYANRMSNVAYCAKLICTNPCGEIWLSEYDCCCLGAVVLPRFVQDGKIQWDELAETVRLGVRFLDDVLTVNTYPLPEIKDVCSSLRRIGLGVMGLHDMLLMLGMKYTTDRALELVDEVMAFIKNTAYEASIDLAKEKSPFSKFRAEEFLKSGFAKTLKPSLRTKIAEHGIRNCALLTIAPTGTTSMVQNVTSGIEPMFAPAYRRRFRDGEELREEVVVHPLFQQFVQDGRSVKHFQGAYQLKIRDHFEMQRICQKHLDNACSKTINLMPGTSAAELSDLYMEFLPELKGLTVYPEGSRADQPLTPMSHEEAMEHIQGASAEVEGGACRSGVCEI